MIPVKVDECGMVKLRLGDKATLVANNSYPFSKPDFIDAVYFGFTPGNKRSVSGYSPGKGHLFAVLNSFSEPLFYLAGSLKMEHWSDGCDDPAYSVGINAWRTNSVNLNTSENEYVVSVLTRKKDLSDSFS